MRRSEDEDLDEDFEEEDEAEEEAENPRTPAGKKGRKKGKKGKKGKKRGRHAKRGSAQRKAGRANRAARREAIYKRFRAHARKSSDGMALFKRARTGVGKPREVDRTFYNYERKVRGGGPYMLRKGGVIWSAKSSVKNAKRLTWEQFVSASKEQGVTWRYVLQDYGCGFAYTYHRKKKKK